MNERVQGVDASVRGVDTRVQRVDESVASLEKYTTDSFKDE